MNIFSSFASKNIQHAPQDCHIGAHAVHTLQTNLSITLQNLRLSQLLAHVVGSNDKFLLIGAWN
jgi:hypothetical protein